MADGPFRRPNTESLVLTAPAGFRPLSLRVRQVRSVGGGFVVELEEEFLLATTSDALRGEDGLVQRRRSRKTLRVVDKGSGG